METTDIILLPSLTLAELSQLNIQVQTPLQCGGYSRARVSGEIPLSEHIINPAPEGDYQIGETEPVTLEDGTVIPSRPIYLGVFAGG